MEGATSRAAIYPRPAPGTRTGRVWEIADRISEATGQRAKRSDVLAEVAREDGNMATASTQYQYWKSNYDARRMAFKDAPRVSGQITEQTLKIAPDGRLAIPKAMRDRMQLGEDGQVMARVASGELRLVSRAVAIRHMQEMARSLKKSGESVVDQFLAERRALWGEE